MRTLSGRWRHPWAGPAFGGVIGFVSTYPEWYGMDPTEFVLVPGVTTLFGQVGGFLAMRKYWDEAPTNLPRFSVQTVLVGTAWLALALGVMRGMGLLHAEHSWAVTCWLPWQASVWVTMILVGRGESTGRRGKTRFT